MKKYVQLYREILETTRSLSRTLRVPQNIYHRIILQNCTTELDYGHILLNYITESCDGITLQNCIMDLYYEITLRTDLTEIDYGTISQNYITELYYRITLRIYITEL